MNAPVNYGGVNRLPNRGQFIDRSKPVTFTFEGNFIEGYEGDTIASAARSTKNVAATPLTSALLRRANVRS